MPICTANTNALGTFLLTLEKTPLQYSEGNEPPRGGKVKDLTGTAEAGQGGHQSDRCAGNENILMGDDILEQKQPSPPSKYPSHLLSDLYATWLPSLIDLFEFLLLVSVLEQLVNAGVVVHGCDPALLQEAEAEGCCCPIQANLGY